jgi:hypothetical protein
MQKGAQKMCVVQKSFTFISKNAQEKSALFLLALSILLSGSI